MQPAIAVTALAPSSSTTPANTIEIFVGQRVAVAGMAILEALAERQDGGLTPATKMRGGDVLAVLHNMRQFMTPDWDFDAIARKHGAAALRAADISPPHADVLVDEILNLLHNIARAVAN
jgi:hypothetical protein